MLRFARYMLAAALVTAIMVRSAPPARASVLTDLMAWFYGDVGPAFGAQPDSGPGDGEGDAD
jgi:hypothetical protein